MAEPANRKTVAASRVTLSQLMQPGHANLQGNVHGGWIMKMVDEAGALACIRHSQMRVVTVAVDQMTFKHPIKLGDLVVLESEVSCAGRTSMEAEVNVFAENPRTGQRWHTNTAYVVYVALNENGQPTSVPSLIPETEEEKQRIEEGKSRQAYRLKNSSTK
jgi:acyl-CoA hydrolase